MRAALIALIAAAPAVAAAQACPVTLSDAACQQGLNVSFTHWRATDKDADEKKPEGVNFFGDSVYGDSDWVANLMEIRGRWQALSAEWGVVNAYGGLAATYFSPNPDADARFDAITTLEAGAAARIKVADGIEVPLRLGVAFQPEDGEAGGWLLRGRGQDQALAISDGLTVRAGGGVAVAYKDFLIQLDGNADMPLGDDPIRDRAVVGAGAMVEGPVWRLVRFQAELAYSTPLEEAEIAGVTLEDPSLINLGVFATAHVRSVHLALGMTLPLGDVGADQGLGILANLGFSL